MKIPKPVIAFNEDGTSITAVDPTDLEDLGDVELITDINHPVLPRMFKPHTKSVIVAQTVDMKTFMPKFVVEFEGKRYCYNLQLAIDWNKNK
jgi:hypothetical protein